MMRKAVLLTLGLLWALVASAQYIPEWHQGDLGRKGTVLTLQGEKQDAETTRLILTQTGGPEMVSSWDRYSLERNWGIGLTSGGYALMAAGLCYGGVYFLAGIVGTMFVAIGGQQAVDKLWSDLGPRVTIGGIATLVGFAAGTTGVVLLCVGNRHLRTMTATCDAAGLPPLSGEDTPQAALTFGPTPSGVGFALRF